MVCNHCGKALPEGIAFCPNCGTPCARQPIQQFDNSAWQKLHENELYLAKRYRRNTVIRDVALLLIFLIAFVFHVSFSVSTMVNRNFILKDDYWLIIIGAIFLVGGIAAAIGLVSNYKYNSRIYNEISMIHNPFEPDDLSDREVVYRKEVLPYSYEYVYNACVYTAQRNFRRPCIGIPYNQIYIGWWCSSATVISDKIMIDLTPVSNGTEVVVRFTRPKERRKTRQIERTMFAGSYIRCVRSNIQNHRI